MCILCSYRKPQGSALPYSHQPTRQRVQYITLQQLAALQAQAAQFQAQEQKQHQQLQPEPNYEALLQQYHKPQPAPAQQQQPIQYASSAIVGTSTGTYIFYFENRARNVLQENISGKY